MIMSKPSSIAAHLVAIAFVGGAVPCRAAEPLGLPAYLSDRGDGITTSLFGTYIREKEFLFYPFYEYTYTGKFEYEPIELGFSGNQEFSGGKLEEHEFLLFFAYGFTDSLAVELESAVYSSADFTKDPSDTTGVRNIRESGLGDTEVNIRWRHWKETASRPEITFFFQTVFPFQKNKRLIGTQDWEFVPGIVLTKGYPFGTLALRLSAAYDTGENKAEFDEWAIDYVKRLAPVWRVVLSLEGEQTDEVSIIGEVQYTLSENAVLKINSGFGLTEKAPDVAPEIGVLFRF
ncbi:MAG TPA: transporter [Candidatus Deferrimicrobiaceae bacterium]|jgi:hypothetical protein|nr:transporter [Candidatus Deferrimicrobiaceae bacterium]